jgi:hypothetical protein
MPTGPYGIGKPFDIATLKAPRRAKAPNPRDVALEKAIKEASVAAESQVIPFTFPDTEKVGTVKAAAKRIAADLVLPVNVGAHAAYPNTILLSRGVLSNRGRKRS